MVITKEKNPHWIIVAKYRKLSRVKSSDHWFANKWLNDTIYA